MVGVGGGRWSGMVVRDGGLEWWSEMVVGDGGRTWWSEMVVGIVVVGFLHVFRQISKHVTSADAQRNLSF